MSVFDQGIWYADLDHSTCSASNMRIIVHSSHYKKKKTHFIFYFYLKYMMYWLYKLKQHIKAERPAKRVLCLYQVKLRHNDSQRQWGGWGKQIPIKVSLILKRLLLQLCRLLILSGIIRWAPIPLFPELGWLIFGTCRYRYM